MKNQITALLAVPVLLLCSCGKSYDNSESLPESFTVNAQISDRDFSATAEMQRREGGWEITLTEPETLEGMRLDLTDADCTVTYGELTYTAANDDMPANSAVRLTAQALDRCVRSKTSGMINGAEYKLSLKNGKPEKLTVGGEIEVTFSDFKA